MSFSDEKTITPHFMQNQKKQDCKIPDPEHQLQAYLPTLGKLVKSVLSQMKGFEVFASY